MELSDTDQQTGVMANQQHIVIDVKLQKKAVVKDVAIPSDCNKEHKKLMKCYCIWCCDLQTEGVALKDPRNNLRDLSSTRNS